MSALESAAWFGVSLVTLLGDPLVIAGLGFAVYWFGDQIPTIGDRISEIGPRLDPDRRALAFAAITGALALSAALKTGFGIARLPGAADLPGLASMPDIVVPVYTWIVGPGGHAFPSGHATAATVGWLGLARASRGENRNRGLALAGGLVVAIAASRVALGVHRPHEVLAGIGVGLAYLVVTVGLLEGARRAFALAGVIGVAGPIAVGLTGDSLLVAGVALGTAIGWELTREREGVAVTGPAVATLLGALVVVVATAGRSGAFETAVALVGIGGGATIVAGQRWVQKIEI